MITCILLSFPSPIMVCISCVQSIDNIKDFEKEYTCPLHSPSFQAWREVAAVILPQAKYPIWTGDTYL